MWFWYADSLWVLYWSHMTHRFAHLLLGLIWGIACLHVGAEYFHLYWRYRWLDIPMHFLGGVWLGMLGVWCWHAVRSDMPSYARVVVVACSTAFMLGCVWEAYEYAVFVWGGSALPSNYAGDTALDLLMDLTGALVAGVGWASGTIRKKRSTAATCPVVAP